MKPTVILALFGILLAALPAAAGDEGQRQARREIIPFSDARIRIEINSTDGDSGMHVLLDAEGWKYVKIFTAIP